MGLKERMLYYPMSSISKTGEFDIATHKDSFLNKAVFNQKGGVPMLVQGPIGSIKFLGQGRFFK